MMIAQSEIRMSPKAWSSAGARHEMLWTLDKVIAVQMDAEQQHHLADLKSQIKATFNLLEMACAAAGVSDPIAMVEEIERLRNVPMAELTPAPRRSWLMRILFGG
jgi:hypothetical protein